MEILTVSQANLLARKVLEEYSIWIKGELSDLKPDKYFYRYFALKDENALINCLFQSSRIKDLDFPFEAGITVRAFGTLSLYEKRGDYQFKIEKIEKDGEGNLQAKIEEIKTKLQKEGLFDDDRKKPLPQIPKKIAVITSDDSAAWKDFYKIINVRYPNIEIILCNVLVQGEKASKEVIAALEKVNALPEIDLIVITRGGGSLEDLMAFNDESLARTVSQSRYPVVSAVGHEKDVSILDLVADLRASTPSNAAELITPDSAVLFQWLDQAYQKMKRWSDHALAVYALNLTSTIDRSMIIDENKFFEFHLNGLELITTQLISHKNIYEKLNNQIDYEKERMFFLMTKLIESDRRDLVTYMNSLEQRSELILNNYSQEIEKINIKLELHNPLQILEKGYSIVTSKDGKVIKTIKGIKAGEEIYTKLKDGTINSTISTIQKNERK